MKDKILTPEEIADKYVYGKHNALTDSQEVKDMIADISNLAMKAYESGYQQGGRMAADDIFSRV